MKRKPLLKERCHGQCPSLWQNLVKNQGLRPPQKKPDRKKPEKGGMGGFGKRIPDDDQRTLVGAAVFGIILIVLVGAGYYFLVYAPYQDALGTR